MQAKLSQTTTGVKSFLLKPVDPFFRKKMVRRNHLLKLPELAIIPRSDWNCEQKKEAGE